MTVKEVRIIEYNPELAAAVADMWNKSADGWGGSATNVTAEHVAQQEANSDNINLYLAMMGDEVVGYCGLSEYREDEGSLYIPLLNVRGDYHGKKLGKKLLLKALERSIELGWPRLDLYTWPGNTKAVPLYKKCGFFWEERDETTHLMNFIPSVINNEVVKDYFEEIDWYQDSQRIIELKPDGRKENGFDYYEYQWEKNNRKLRMEFERRGRGLRLVETDDYLIAATVEDSELVFGKDYEIFYDIINKSGKPLEVILTGENNKNIDFNFNEKILLDQVREMRIEAKFKVGEIEEEQSIWRTHPAVITNLSINGKETSFRVGILPKFPVKVSTKAHGKVSTIGDEGYFYLNIENNFDEEVEVTLDFPKIDFVEVQQRVNSKLEGRGKKSITIPYVLKDFGFYGATLDVNVKPRQGSPVCFKKKIGFGLKGFGEKFAGEGEDFWHIYNGAYEAGLSKFNNSLWLGKEILALEPTRTMAPKLGKPYSSEFNKKRPTFVESYEEKGAIVLKATYDSTSFEELQLITYIKLFAEGLLEQTWEVKNVSDRVTPFDIWLNHPIFQKLYRSVLPYDDEIIELEDSIGSGLSEWDSNRVTENWLFSRADDEPRGICWSTKYKVNFSNWFMYFEYPLGRIEAGDSVKTDPLYISLGAYPKWDDFRKFALKKLEPKPKTIKAHLEFTVNNHNPIVKDCCTATVKSYRSEYFNGSLEIDLLSEETPQLKRILKQEDEIKELQMEIRPNINKKIDVVGLQSNVFTQERRLHTLLLKEDAVEINCEKTIEEGVEVYSVDNGTVRVKAAPNYFPSIFSMNYNGEEWLDHSFPMTKPKSWWNPWGGGSGHYFMGISNNSYLKENSKAEFITMKDQHQNEWRGIKLHTKVEENKEYKGLKWNQYFLMIPGVPVVCSVVEILQETGSYLPQLNWEYAGFMKLTDGEKTGWVKSFDQGVPTNYVTGKGAIEIKASSSLVCGMEGRRGMLQIVNDLRSSSLELYMNKEVSLVACLNKLNMESGKSVFATPVFYVFTDEVIPEDALRDLRNIRFE
ncbi:GNAT family N-acetyltransferase [Alkaliphilus hydrothermalis]|uniref:Ribosomal protein S18 acetylase RimI-like enzyme n=1 Tax=Alkaliphilus hydrothermalis TaxID=1482730 RepID=A0ABS2NM87_9FIRM|nr:GNAT family N-acetyltransferase [Alkaliphilus hydrothermalis]MBM7614038.1 ribosomal protein S18 acetylase RimI-like enzyme [Alkaliphilus hydrothermalis]